MVSWTAQVGACMPGPTNAAPLLLGRHLYWKVTCCQTNKRTAFHTQALHVSHDVSDRCIVCRQSSCWTRSCAFRTSQPHGPLSAVHRCDDLTAAGGSNTLHLQCPKREMGSGQWAKGREKQNGKRNKRTAEARAVGRDDIMSVTFNYKHLKTVRCSCCTFVCFQLACVATLHASTSRSACVSYCKVWVDGYVWGDGWCVRCGKRTHSPL
jgi:hypothetical protein